MKWSYLMIVDSHLHHYVSCLSFTHWWTLAFHMNSVFSLLYLGQWNWLNHPVCAGMLSMSFKCCPGTAAVYFMSQDFVCTAHYLTIYIHICAKKTKPLMDVSKQSFMWLLLRLSSLLVHILRFIPRQPFDSGGWRVIHLSSGFNYMAFNWTRHDSTYWISHVASKKLLVQMLVAGLLAWYLGTLTVMSFLC